MDFRANTLAELARRSRQPARMNALVGLDGFVDKIVQPVRQRFGRGKAYEPVTTIAEFGGRISAAAGLSTNIELFPLMEKLGGNGPIMGNALLGHGFGVTYIGNLGRPTVAPVFADFARRAKVHSIAEPGITHAVEFTDGKIMLGNTASLDEITYERILESVGEGAFLDMFNRADLVALVNWTMIPAMSEIFEALLDKVLPSLGTREGGRMFFFDLADPEKRPPAELGSVVRLIARFSAHGRVILGLNLKEARQVASVLGLPVPAGEDPETLKSLASAIRSTLDLPCVVVHPTARAAAATREGAWCVAGPYCEKPLITTGAGDHFNAGFCAGQLLGLSVEASLAVAVSTSGLYVRTARSPSLGEIEAFLRSGSTP